MDGTPCREAGHPRENGRSVKEIKLLGLRRRIHIGPGPSGVSTSALQVMRMPLVAGLDPQFPRMMGETKELLRHLFHTENKVAIPTSVIGTAGDEACLCNLIELGNWVLVCVHGFFGERSDVHADRLRSV